MLRQGQFVFNQIFDLYQEPGIDLGAGKYVFHTHAMSEGIAQVPNSIGTGYGQFAVQNRFWIFSLSSDLRVKARGINFEATEGFLQGLLEGAANGHYLAHRFHLGSQRLIGFLKLLKSEAWNFGDNVINAWLKGSRGCAASDFVLQLVEGVTYGQFRRHSRNRETSGL